MRIAHLSDIHFFKCELTFENFFSKNILGTINSIINRKRNGFAQKLEKLIPFLKDQQVTHIIISGDFTTTSNQHEYADAREFLSRLREQNFKVFIVPGNHDHYNKSAAVTKKFFTEFAIEGSYKEDGFICEDFGEGFKWIGLDTTCPTPFWSSQGLFSKKLEEKLESLLSSIPEAQPLIVVNHFPIVTQTPLAKRKQLVRREQLKQLIEKYRNIKLYLCGHTHKSLIMAHQPVILNSGSLTLTDNGCFHLMNLTEQNLSVDVCHYDNSQGWIKISNKHLELV